MDTKELAGIIAMNFNGYSLDSESIKITLGDFGVATKKAIAQHINAICDGRVSRTVADWAATEQGKKCDRYLGCIHPCVLDGFIRYVILAR